VKQKLNSLEKAYNPFLGVLHEKDETNLFYVQEKINGNSVTTMVDSGVTHNFLREDMVQRLGMQPKPM